MGKTSKFGTHVLIGAFGVALGALALSDAKEYLVSGGVETNLESFGLNVLSTQIAPDQKPLCAPRNSTASTFSALTKDNRIVEGVHCGSWLPHAANPETEADVFLVQNGKATPAERKFIHTTAGLLPIRR